ncbi:MAG: DUF922 domain-containing protein [Proteobacteria bacterium]|nr:DUF922 domain-containing protein [Pseudomonadota bacterium]
MRFITLFINLFSGFIFSLLSFAATAEVTGSREYKYYEISPRTAYEIKPELMRRSPIREGGGTFNGHTDWYVDWRYQSSQPASGCQVHDIRTTVRVIHTLPVLSQYVTDQQTIDVFTRFSDALTKHEINHGNNGISAAREMDKAFNEVPAQQSCRNLARIIDSICNTTIQKYIQADNDYDHMTRNGETEGAVIY